MQEPHWILKDVAMAMHDRQLAEHGGGTGVRDESLLESELTKPQNVFLYSDEPVSMPRLAASYAYGIATNHPFVDGNKRMAHVIARTFLLLNGYNLTASQEEKYKTIYDLAAGKINEKTLTQWFEKNAKKI